VVGGGGDEGGGGGLILLVFFVGGGVGWGWEVGGGVGCKKKGNVKKLGELGKILSKLSKVHLSQR